MSKWLIKNQLWQLTVALFKEILREPGVLFLGNTFPHSDVGRIGNCLYKESRRCSQSGSCDEIRYCSGDPSTSSSLRTFSEASCEKNPDPSDESFGWKLVLSNNKLGNSVFYFI